MRIRVDRDACQTAAICLQYQLSETQIMYELDDDSLAVIKTRDGADSNKPDAALPLADAEGWVDLKDVAGYDASDEEKMRNIALEAAKNCPFNAIIVEDDAGTVVWPEEL